MKKIVLFIIVAAFVSLTGISSFAQSTLHSQYGNTQAEAVQKAMALCKKRARNPQRCKLVALVSAANNTYQARVSSHK
jgi:hypothetical protein